MCHVVLSDDVSAHSLKQDGMPQAVVVSHRRVYLDEGRAEHFDGKPANAPSEDLRIFAT